MFIVTMIVCITLFYAKHRKKFKQVKFSGLIFKFDIAS